VSQRRDPSLTPRSEEKSGERRSITSAEGEKRLAIEKAIKNGWNSILLLLR
jgi:hypothetical protein